MGIQKTIKGFKNLVFIVKFALESHKTLHLVLDHLMASAVKRYTGTASTIMESSYQIKQITLKVRRPRDKNYQKIMYKKRSNNLTKKQRQSYQKNKT